MRRLHEDVGICELDGTGSALKTSDDLPFLIRRIFSADQYGFICEFSGGTQVEFQGYFLGGVFSEWSSYLNDTKEIAIFTNRLTFKLSNNPVPEEAKIFVVVQLLTIDQKVTYGVTGI